MAATTTGAILLPPTTRPPPPPRYALRVPEDPTREPTRASFNRLLRLHCASGDPDASLSLLSRMGALGVPADAPSYSSLVSSLAYLGRTLEADALLLEMRLLGLPPPPPRSLIPLLSAFLRDGLLPPALRLLSSYLRPDRPTLLALLHHFALSRRPDATHLVLSHMRRRHFLPLPPSAYARLLSMYRDVGMWGKALRVVEEMRHSGVPFDSRVYHAVIDTLGRCGRTEAMARTFERMHAEGVRPGVATWNAVIKWSCRGAARGLLQRMMDDGVRPDPSVFLPVISRLGEEGRWGEVREVFEGMRRRGFLGSGAVYAVVADIYGQYGAFRNARGCVAALRAEGVELTPRVFCVLANAYAQQVAFACFHEHNSTKELCGGNAGYRMERQWTRRWYSFGTRNLGVGCLFTSSAVVHYKWGLCEQAVQVFRLMEAEGIEPNLKMLNLLMNAFGVAGRYLEAESIFEHIKESGLTPDVVTYTTLMKAFMRAKKFEQVLKIFQDMEDAGCTADRKALELLETASDALRQRGFVL